MSENPGFMMFHSTGNQQSQKNSRNAQQSSHESSRNNARANQQGNTSAVVDEFKKVYESRVRELDSNSGVSESQKMTSKIQILTDWIRDLEEQNKMLIENIDHMEISTVCKVQGLENTLAEHTSSLQCNISQLNQSQQNCSLLKDKIRDLEIKNKEQQEELDLLQSKIISEGSRRRKCDIDCNNTIPESQLSDNPLASSCGYTQGKGDAEEFKSNLLNTQNNFRRKNLMDCYEHQEKILQLEQQNYSKDILIEKYISEVKNIRDNLKKRFNLEKYNACKMNEFGVECSITKVTVNHLEQETSLNSEENDNNCKKKCKDVMSEKRQFSRITSGDAYETLSSFQNALRNENEINRDLRRKLACLEEEYSESREALAQEVANKHDQVVKLKNKISSLEERHSEFDFQLTIKDDIIDDLRKKLKEKHKAASGSKQVRISTESTEEKSLQQCHQKSSSNNPPEIVRTYEKQIEQLKELVDLRDDEISNLKMAQNTEEINIQGESRSTENFHECTAILNEITNYFKKQIELASSSRMDLHTSIEKLQSRASSVNNDDYEDVAAERVNELIGILADFNATVINKDQSKSATIEFILLIKKKVFSLRDLLQNKCQEKEKPESELKDIISNIHGVTKKLIEINTNSDQALLSIHTMVETINLNSGENNQKEEEQRAILDAIIKQFRMMEEFRLCTVEVQAATEDLKEEIASVVASLNVRHCKYLELSNVMKKFDEYLTHTNDKVNNVLNQIHLQNEERVRYNNRINTNEMRLKDIKNEINKSNSELSKYLKNVHNSQQAELLGYSEMKNCNDLLSSVVDEVDQIISNLKIFENHQKSSASFLSDLCQEFNSIDNDLKQFKSKTGLLFDDTETSQSDFEKQLERLEKYESEVDHCHTKMQDALESIVCIREQLIEYGCIKSNQDSFEHTKELIELKSQLRKLSKECDDLKLQSSQSKSLPKYRDSFSDMETHLSDLNTEINKLKREVKQYQDANCFLKRNIENLEKDLSNVQQNSEECRRIYSSESFKLKKRIFDLENTVSNHKNSASSFKRYPETIGVKLQKSYTRNNNTQNEPHKGLENASSSKLDKHLSELSQLIEKNIKSLQESIHQLSHLSNVQIPKSTNDILIKNINDFKECLCQLEKSKEALDSSDKLMKNMDEIIQIQKDSINISQEELEDLRKTTQQKEEKIFACHKENKHLENQIGVHLHNIRKLQTAVLTANKTVEEVSSSATNDSLEKSRMIKDLRSYLEETENQYHDCFGEAARQNSLIEVQRNSIKSLQEKLNITHLKHFINEKIDLRNKEIKNYRAQINQLEERNKVLADKLLNLHANYTEKNGTLMTLKLKSQDYEKQCTEKQVEINALKVKVDEFRSKFVENESLFIILRNEISQLRERIAELDNCKLEVSKLRSENEKLLIKLDLNKNLREEIYNLKDRVKFFEKSQLDILKVQEENANLNKEFESLSGSFERTALDNYKKKEKIKNLKTQVFANMQTINQQMQLINCGQNELLKNEYHLKKYVDELQGSKILLNHFRTEIATLKVALKDTCEKKSKLESENGCMKSENKILKSENDLLRDRIKSDKNISESQLKNMKYQVITLQNNNAKISRDYDKCQKLLMEKLKTGYDKNFSSKEEKCYTSSSDISCKNNCQETIDTLSTELDKTKDTLNTKINEIQNRYSCLLSKSESLERNNSHLKDEILLLEKSNNTFKQKLQICSDKNMDLIKQNQLLEDSNNKCMAELNEMHKCLADLKSECETKTRSLETLSSELSKVKITKSEEDNESKSIMSMVRIWMEQQEKLTDTELTEKDRELTNLKFLLKKSSNEIKDYKRRNIRLKCKLKHRPCIKQVCRQNPSTLSTSRSECSILSPRFTKKKLFRRAKETYYPFTDSTVSQP